MSMHVTARLAWHNDGWNGHLCREPERNTYCVGSHSFPGAMISENRNLDWEKQCSGLACAGLKQIPPCIYSINAFGEDSLTAFAEPPEFFDPGTRRKEWAIPPATVCTWPYEEMYRGEVKTSKGYYDNDARFDFAERFFAQVEPNDSLIFYYANYSNPMSTEEAPRYVLVGLSRVREVGKFLYYEGCNQETKTKFGGGFVWDRNITSHYPEFGLRLPYHLYKDDPRRETFTLYPEDPQVCKYGSRLMSDDQALGLVEQFHQAVTALIELGDTSDNWRTRREWLEGLISELWKRRGAFPGLPEVCKFLNFTEAIPFFKAQVKLGNELKAAQMIWDCLLSKDDSLGRTPVTQDQLRDARRHWKLLGENDRRFAMTVIARLDIKAEAIAQILGEDRETHGLKASSSELFVNPYLLVEQFVGDHSEDRISWSQIDRAAIPSPELGVKSLTETDSPIRLRALIYECLLRVSGHTFLDTEELVRLANKRLAPLPEWKQITFKAKYFEVDDEIYQQSLHITGEEGPKLVYRGEIYEDERLVEREIKSLLNRPLIQLRIPMIEEHWENFLIKPESPLAIKARTDYKKAIEIQAEACKHVFTRSFSVLCGAAGTGKTTVLSSIVKAIRKVDGQGASVMVLAPTGKAADRAREIFSEEKDLHGSIGTSTIHSFIARLGWLNGNMTFKRKGGELETKSATIIIDECSMMDLQLFATLFRAIRWSAVKRIILVGDPNQLPPIGTGRVFADVVDFCRTKEPDSIAELTVNLRQLESKATGNGTGIIDLASLYRRSNLVDITDEESDLAAEDIMRRVQGGGDVDKDLRVLFWQEPEDLAPLLLNRMTEDMSKDAGADLSTLEFHEIWDKAYDGKPEYAQVLSPYRGELFGIEALNQAIQKKKSSHLLRDKGHLDGITLFDKVIQIRNRTISDPIFGYDQKTDQTYQVDVFNGELGFVEIHKSDLAAWKRPSFRIERFAVGFSRKGETRVGYGKNLGKRPNGKWGIDQKVEDNLELGYAVSVHKAQGSEFQRIYMVVPASNRQLLSQELLYTGLTRGKKHCTLLVQRDVGPLVDMRRRERCWLAKINSSLLGLHVAPKALTQNAGWYEAGKIHEALTRDMVRSKSEVIIANLLFERGIEFRYEIPLFASDGSMYLPDFTINWQGEELYWEHVGMLHREDYKVKWEAKEKWYKKHFAGRLLLTFEGSDLSLQAEKIVEGLSLR